MDDDRIIEFERALWVGDGDVYRRNVSSDCLMVVPEQPFLLSGNEAIERVEATPRWSQVEFSDFTVKRPQAGLIVLAYQVDAEREGERYAAYCTSTYQRQEHDDWVVIQHQQTPRIAKANDGATAMDVAQKQASEEREDQRGYQ